jgi:elongation factor Ts
VARTEAFQNAAAGFVGIALHTNGDLAALLKAPAPGGEGCVSDMIARLSARTGEHISLRRCAFVAAARGVVASYVHNVKGPGLGSIGVLVALESTADTDALVGIGQKVGMHIAASSPLWVSQEDIPPDVLREKRAVLADEARKTGKPPHIVEKMVDGRLRKFHAEVVLCDQAFVLNPDQTVGQALADAAEFAGAAIRVGAFARFRTGEGVKKVD